jgi:hypothetical protein
MYSTSFKRSSKNPPQKTHCEYGQSRNLTGNTECQQNWTLNIQQVQEEPHSYKATDNRKTENVTTERPEMKKTKQRFVTFSNFKNFVA